jgi:hypothetical protein
MTISVGPNDAIDDELALCPPANDPRCPECGHLMNTISGTCLLWACGNERCRNTTVYLWRDGELLPEFDEVDQ